MRQRSSGSVTVNTAANLVSQVVAPAMGLILIPVYLRFVGLAGYGLIALLAALLAATGVFTRGMGWSLQREVARARAVRDEARLHRLVTTFSAVYLAISVTLGTALAAASGPLSATMDGDDISRGTVRTCLLILSLRLVTLFPSSVFIATLLGTQRQVTLNMITSVSLITATAATVAGIARTGSVVVIYAVDLVASALTLLALRTSVMKDLQQTSATRFLSRREIRELAGMSGALIWIQAIGILIRQVDRFVVGALTSLASLGVYTASIAAGRLLSLAYSPFLTAVFPKSCELAEQDRSAMPAHLIANSRVVALTSVGVGVPVALGAQQLLIVWTGEDRLADKGGSVLVVFVLATMFLSLADAQSQVQTAMGSTRCAVAVNSLSVLWLPVTLIMLVREFGIDGAAVAWLVYAVSTWVAFTYYSFGRLMPGNMIRYFAAMALPVLTLTIANIFVSAFAGQLTDDSALAYLAIAVPGAMIALAATVVMVVGARTTAQAARAKIGRRHPALLAETDRTT